MENTPASILLTCIGYASQAAKTEKLARVTAAEWQQVVELAHQQGVAQFLHHHLRLLNIPLPDEPGANLKQAYRQNALRNLRLVDDLKKVLSLLHAQGIPVLVLKGAYLAEAVYEHIALRTMGDVDLLVKPSDLERVDDSLVKMGCEPLEHNRVIRQDRQHFVYRLPNCNMPLEMHWTILPPKAAFRLDEERLWERALPGTLAGIPTLAFTLEDLLLHLCMHTAKHADGLRMRMICDIGEVLRKRGESMNWQEFSARARQWQAQRAVYLTLRLARELLGAAVPGDWLESVRPADFHESYFLLAREQMLGEHSAVNPSEDAFHLSKLWAAPGLRSKLEVLRYALLPPRETIERHYPVRAHSWQVYLYYPVRIKDILFRSGAALRQVNATHLNAAERSDRREELRDWLMSE